jgi:hypothetical protein
MVCKWWLRLTSAAAVRFRSADVTLASSTAALLLLLLLLLLYMPLLAWPRQYEQPMLLAAAAALISVCFNSYHKSLTSVLSCSVSPNTIMCYAEKGKDWSIGSSIKLQQPNATSCNHDMYWSALELRKTAVNDECSWLCIPMCKCGKYAPFSSSCCICCFLSQLLFQHSSCLLTARISNSMSKTERAVHQVLSVLSMSNHTISSKIRYTKALRPA